MPTVYRLQGVTALSMRIFTHSISPGRSRLERRPVQPPRSVQVRAEKLFQLDLINLQGTAACCAYETAGVDVKLLQIATANGASRRARVVYLRELEGWVPP